MKRLAFSVLLFEAFAVMALAQDQNEAREPRRLPVRVMQSWERFEKQVQKNRETYDKANEKALAGFQRELERMNPPVEVDDLVKQFQQEAIVKLDVDARPPAPPPPDKDIVVFNGHRYKLFMERKSRAEAVKHCEALGGSLMTIEGKQEHGFLVPRLREFLQRNDNLNDNQYVWIGVRHNKQTGTLVDPNGGIVTYGEFEPTHPKADKEGVAMKMTTGRLFSFGEDSELPFVCEWDK